MAKHNVRFVVPYEGRVEFHEGLLVRAAIALKVLYGNSVNIVVVTGSRSFVDSLHGAYSPMFPVTVLSHSEMSRFNLRTHTVILTSDKHPFLDTPYGSGMDRFIIPMVDQIDENLSFDSVFFGRSFAYPDLRKIEDILPPEIRVLKPKSHILRGVA